MMSACCKFRSGLQRLDAPIGSHRPFDNVVIDPVSLHLHTKGRKENIKLIFINILKLLGFNSLLVCE